MFDPNGHSAFVACYLIALDKCPGVRPIGVGKVVRRIVGKSVLSTLKMDILEVVGPLQLKILVKKLQFMQCVPCLMRRTLSLFYWWMQAMLLIA